MGLLVSPLKPFGSEMSIDLRGDEVGVAKQFLHAAQVSAAVQQVGGIAVAQSVGG